MMKILVGPSDKGRQEEVQAAVEKAVEISPELLDRIKKREPFNPEREEIGDRSVGIVVGGVRRGFLGNSE